MCVFCCAFCYGNGGTNGGLFCHTCFEERVFLFHPSLACEQQRFGTFLTYNFLFPRKGQLLRQTGVFGLGKLWQGLTAAAEQIVRGFALERVHNVVEHRVHRATQHQRVYVHRVCQAHSVHAVYHLLRVHGVVARVRNDHCVRFHKCQALPTGFH